MPPPHAASRTSWARPHRAAHCPKGPPLPFFPPRLAAISSRRRGRTVLAWLAATVVIIALGSAMAGEYDADYNTPGSESKAASELTEERFAGFTGQEVFVVWKDADGADSPAVQQRVDAFLTEAKSIEHIEQETPIRISENGQIGA